MSHPSSQRTTRDLLTFPFDQRNAVLMERQPGLRILTERLLQLGGTRVVLPLDGEPDLEIILSRGYATAGPARCVPMQASQCHRNASLLFRRKKEAVRIVTGYALSEDGIWRQHTWAWVRDGHPPLLETTEPRMLYYGVLLTCAESEQFARSQGV